jgi:hypothetical protein
MEDGIMTAKLVHDLSTDWVSITLAQDWGEEFDLNVQPRFPQEGFLPANGSGLIVDLNNLALQPGERTDLLARIECCLLPYPVAIATYDLEKCQVERLEHKGLIVGRWVDRNLIERLAKAIDEEQKEKAA